MVRIIKRRHALLCQADIHQPLLQPVDENGQRLFLFIERGGVVADRIAVKRRAVAWRRMMPEVKPAPGNDVIVLVAGLGIYVAFLYGLFVADTRQLWWIGGGIVGLVLGTAFLAPFVGRPVISGLGWVYRTAFGSIGRMAEQNSVRNPGRTAATASALMIGMTLVALMGVVATSTTASVDQQIEETFRADYILSNAVGQPFSSTVAERVAEVDGVREVSPVRFSSAQVDGSGTPATGASAALIDRLSTDTP